MKKQLKENAIHLAIGGVLLLIIIGGVLSYFNRQTMNRALVAQAQSEAALVELVNIDNNIRFMDISARGYALTYNPDFLFWKVSNAKQQNAAIFSALDSLFAIQEFKNPKYEGLKKAMDNYAIVFAKMIQLIEGHEMDEYLKMLNHDYGKDFYVTYSPFITEINTFEKTQASNAQHDYESAINLNIVVQILLILIGSPTLCWIFYRIRKDDRERKRLLLDLEKNNKQYLFDSGNDSGNDVKQILKNSIVDLQQASRFVSEISVGNYQVQWEGLKKENEKLNKENLAGKLVYMREEMKRMKEDDRKRIWSTQGLSDVSDIIRKHQGNLKDLNWHVLTFIVKTLNGQQGSIFVTRQNGEEKYLELSACYAFERRKFLEKTVNPGQGLIGEAFLSGETTFLKKVPQGYISITSGLGDASPTCIVIVPMKHNDEVLSVIEIASFHEFEPYQISFLEKAGEFMASAISTVVQAERNKVMMDQLSSQTEQLRAQEEELRQNIEELETTQEVMRRQSIK